MVHLRSALLASTTEIFVSVFPHRSLPHRFLCSSMRCFENSPRWASSGGLSGSIPVSHQRISMPLGLFQVGKASSHTRFAAWRSGGFLAQMFNRRTALEPTTKLSYEALNPPLCQTAVGGSGFYIVNKVFSEIFASNVLIISSNSIFASAFNPIADAKPILSVLSRSLSFM